LIIFLIQIKYCNNDVKGVEYFQTNNEQQLLEKDNNKIVQIEKTKQKELDSAVEIEREKNKAIRKTEKNKAERIRYRH
jgi:hypothetical protein